MRLAVSFPLWMVFPLHQCKCVDKAYRITGEVSSSAGVVIPEVVVLLFNVFFNVFF